MAQKHQAENYDDGGPIVRRGLLPHFEWMGPHGGLLFLWFLLRAEWRKGKAKGTLRASVADMARGTFMDRKTVIKAKHLLESHGLIQALEKPARFKPTLYRIPKFETSTADGTPKENNPPSESEWGPKFPESESQVSLLKVPSFPIDGPKLGTLWADNPTDNSSLQASKHKHKQKQSSAANAADTTPRRSRKKNNAERFTCPHGPCCPNRPWHICEVIREASELPALGKGEKYSGKVLALAKQHLADTPDEDISGTVRMMRRNPFWDSKPIPPSTVAENLGHYRKLKDSPATWEPPAMTLEEAKAISRPKVLEFPDPQGDDS